MFQTDDEKPEAVTGRASAEAYAGFIGKLTGMKASRRFVEPRAGFADAVMERVGRESGRTASRALVPALIAGVACLLLGIFAGARWMHSINSRWTEARFTFAAPEAQIVEVAGDFTDWERVPMARHNGEWVATIRIPREGRFEYVFVVNRNLIMVDPRGGDVELDASGNAYSVLDASEINI